MNKIFVIEGTDGSGKQTQANLIYKRLLESGRDILKTSFPNYENPSSGPVKEYLSGNITKNPNDVSSKAASCFYAVDRYISYKQDIEKYLDEQIANAKHQFAFYGSRCIISFTTRSTFHR